ncbi:sulfite reductase, alpha subunit (flavoprotein) [Opitutaceae bacterium TAV1]|nr:sulfite reductase, alpha subunit (flavoprotein) [Opitutaceae bacterium TAV1]
MTTELQTHTAAVAVAAPSPSLPVAIPAPPYISDSAPFSPEQRAWLNGFLVGLFSRQPATPAADAATATTAALTPLGILYGLQTGTAESLARQAAKTAGRRGFVATVFDMAAVTPAQLAQHANLLLITSTYGDGEPPDNARALHDALMTDAIPGTLPATLRFSVCGLGDSNYTLFCQCAKNIDTALEKRGATRAAPRVECDTDYETAFAAWLDAALPALKTEAAPLPLPAEAASAAVESFGKKNPFPARVLTVRNLNGAGSAKEVNHIEFSLEGSGLAYEPGDALGVMPQNCPDLVSGVLAALGCDGEEAVPTPAGELPLRTALARHYDLGKPPAALLEWLGLCGVSAAPTPHDVLDALRAAPALPAGGAAAFAGTLRKLQPRLYSISSSPKAHPGQVHLTVGAVRYEAGGVPRKGVCSTFLAERALAAGTVDVFMHRNKAFRLPAAPATPVIMIGPGTGIAPFRAFLEERRVSGASGQNWLFFGDRKAATDFLYRNELLAWREEGLLTRLETAFSRDQPEKIYVQHRMLEHAAEFHAWLEAGAHLYVCGDANRMAKDVDVALHEVICRAGGKSADEAVAYVQALRAAKRYQRDVY